MKRIWLLIAVLLLPLLAMSQGNSSKAAVRWDIAVYTTSGLSAGGSMPVHYNAPVCTTIPPIECHSGPPEIVLSGSGTFQKHDNGKTEFHAATGGGTWSTQATGTETSGTYIVTDVISFDPAPPFGGESLPLDNIGIQAEMSSGTAVLIIKYSDGSNGTMILEGPNASALGYITVTKDVMVYVPTHGIGCTDGYCLPEGTVFPIFHITEK